MTRDDIYDHLARVYLGKKSKTDKTEEKNKNQFNAWIFINIIITVIIFASSFYGLTAFLTNQRSYLREHIIYSLYRAPIRVSYDFKKSSNPIQSFSVSISPVDVSKYKTLQFSIRGKEEGYPGRVKVTITNKKNETAFYYLQDVGLKWHKANIPLKEFKSITDWSNVTEVTFSLESWNVDKQKGIMLIDDIQFSS